MNVNPLRLLTLCFIVAACCIASYNNGRIQGHYDCVFKIDTTVTLEIGQWINCEAQN